MKLRTIFLVYVFLVIFAKLSQHETKKKLYLLAEQRAASLAKPLVVIGSPSTGSLLSRASAKFMGGNYGCGDVCVDILGCDTCPSSVSADALAFLALQGDNSCVIFISSVLEYVHDLPSVLKEVRRVCGTDYFCVTVSKLLPPFYVEKNGILVNSNVIISTKPRFVFLNLRTFAWETG